MSNSPFILWNPEVEFPSAQTMPDLDIVTHVSVGRATADGFHYLHEPTITRHGDHFIAGWTNHPTLETNAHDELLRGARSKDGLHWSVPETWVAAPEYNSESWNHPIIFSHSGKVWGFLRAGMAGSLLLRYSIATTV